LLECNGFDVIEFRIRYRIVTVLVLKTRLLPSYGDFSRKGVANRLPVCATLLMVMTTMMVMILMVMVSERCMHLDLVEIHWFHGVGQLHYNFNNDNKNDIYGDYNDVDGGLCVCVCVCMSAPPLCRAPPVAWC
jgi:hypothetical protein